MSRPYAILDVFTNQALAGNPLAVVLEADRLDDAAMQKIAAEFNLSETVFVFSARNPAHSASIRIFTPARELPFAGHPTVGTAILLASDRFGEVEKAQDAMVVLEEKVGPVRCGVKLTPKAAGFAEFDAPRISKPVGISLGDKAEVATALNLNSVDIGFENHHPSTFEAGVPFAFVPIGGLDALARARPNLAAWVDALGDGDHNNAFLYCRDTRNHRTTFRARMFAPEMGITEDPATGSAAAAFAGVIRTFDKPTDGTHFIRVEQGFEMGRPSLIDLEIDIEGNELGAIRIGGQAVIVARGELFV
ncbi:PhzF family phenazine biosynthesis protein [Breoghania sp.]|uniref:PhzF family phenazine biosynthesis protein n=1 Tax=Breoghania sp. TaxID=2065378 RepID=UPI00262080E8|nr:PhzF family phenazine biosynthesis protein [Breoghania sp.]MDJ0931197.1 PhzF family phenazine biosynthesis protein [Breoghania sp.]